MYNLSSLLKILPAKNSTTNGKKRPGKSSALFDLYLQELSDGEVSTILYKKHPSKSETFRKLKSRFVKHVTTEVLKNIEEVTFRNEYDQTNFEIQKLIIVSQLLVLKDFC